MENNSFISNSNNINNNNNTFSNTSSISNVSKNNEKKLEPLDLSDKSLSSTNFKKKYFLPTGVDSACKWAEIEYRKKYSDNLPEFIPKNNPKWLNKREEIGILTIEEIELVQKNACNCI
jgi:hypothetical protein